MWNNRARQPAEGPRKRRTRISPGSFDAGLHKKLIDIAYQYIDPEMTGKAPPGMLDRIRAELLRLIRITDAERRDYQRFITSNKKEVVDGLLEEERAALTNSVNLSSDEEKDEKETDSEDDQDLADLVDDNIIYEQEPPKQLEDRTHRRITKSAPDPETDDDERYATLPSEVPSKVIVPSSSLSSDEDDEVMRLTAALESRYNNGNGRKKSNERKCNTSVPKKRARAENGGGARRKKKCVVEEADDVEDLEPTLLNEQEDAPELDSEKAEQNNATDPALVSEPALDEVE